MRVKDLTPGRFYRFKDCIIKILYISKTKIHYRTVYPNGQLGENCTLNASFLCHYLTDDKLYNDIYGD